MNILPSVDTCLANTVSWLAEFEAALQAADGHALRDLFREESHWRDMLAFSWDVTPHTDRESIIADLLRLQPVAHARGFRVLQGRTPPRQTTRQGIAVIEALFGFETDVGPCEGVLRLPVSDPTRAWVFATSLASIRGHEEPIGERRPAGSAYSRDFGGKNWIDRRREEQAFENREPAVLIVGGGQFGITMAARLRLLGIDALVIERFPRVGDTWRRRYHSLALHNQVGKNHFPYIPFPPNWPKYLSKDMLANFIEFYADAMECNVWTSTTFVSGTYDEGTGEWSARVRREDGSERVLKPRHLVFANGFLGGKRKPNVPGLDDFAGEVLHTEDYKTGHPYRGKRAVVLGTGTSGHDCAQDLYGAGADVKIIQRGTTTVVSLEGAAFSDSLYLKDNLPLDDADLLSIATTFPLVERSFQLNTVRAKEHDRELLEGLAARGFKLDDGPNGAGFQMKLLSSHGGYYINCGCSDLIASGDIGLIQWEDAERFVPEGLLMKDGGVEPIDLVITATGYFTQEEVVRELLGDEISKRAGPTWGIGEKGELRNMFVPTGQPGLWFVGGGLSQNRVYSRYLALQIKARELGLVA